MKKSIEKSGGAFTDYLKLIYTLIQLHIFVIKLFFFFFSSELLL